MVKRINRFLDSCVLKAHNIYFLKKKIHPYFLFVDIAGFCAVLFLAYYSFRFDSLDFFKMFFVVSVIYYSYQPFLIFKRQFLKIDSRTFILDLTLFIIPTYFLLLSILKVNMIAALDLLGFELPLIICIGRVGCFLGGCCHGIPTQVGVFYPKELLIKIETHRRYSPSDKATERVLPLQLIESGFCLILFLFLNYYHNLLSARIFLVFLLSYCFFRMVSDFFKQHIATKRFSKFTTTQIVSAILFAISTFILIKY